MYKDVQYRGFSWKKDPLPGSRYDFGQGEVTVINPLHGRILVAKTLAGWHQQELFRSGIQSDDPYTIGDVLTEETPFVDAPEESRTEKLEHDAIAIACDEAHRRGEEIVYMNDFARLQHGFDLVARNPSTGSLVIVEVKGSFDERLQGGATRLLRQTKHKGRQLSHRWIWRSTEETAVFSVSASFFLRFGRQILCGDYSRRLTVVFLGTSRDVITVDEARLVECAGLADRTGIERSKAWLDQIDTSEWCLRPNGPVG
jgi:Holliday junction resolvase-like predicted endonuclease